MNDSHFLRYEELSSGIEVALIKLDIHAGMLSEGMDSMRRTFFILLLLGACASRQPSVVTETRGLDAADLSAITGAHYASLEFSKGDSDLSKESKMFLNELAALVDREGKEIEEIKVLAWADKEYPGKAQKASTKDILLAKERARAIKEYLTDDLHSQEKIDLFNMAKRPGLLSKMVRTEDEAVKNAIEQMGPTATTLGNGKISYSKASKAMVIVDYVDNK